MGEDLEQLKQRIPLLEYLQHHTKGSSNVELEPATLCARVPSASEERGS